MSSQNFDQVRVRAGNFLYWFAWIIEIAACFVGLVISWMILQETNTEIAVAKGLDHVAFLTPGSLLAALPFMMVAIVELTKIPLSTAFYHTQSIGWKVIFAISLLFVATITFETGFNGFERNFARTNLVVDDLKRQLTEVEEKNAEYQRRITELKETTLEKIETQYKDRRKVLSDTHAEQLNAFGDRKKTLNQSVSTEEVQLKRSELEALKNELARVDEKARERIARLEAGYQEGNESKRLVRNEQIDTLNKRIEQLEKEKAGLIEKVDQELDEANFFTRAGVQRRFEESLEELQQRIDQQYEELNKVASSITRGDASSKFANGVEEIEKSAANQREIIQIKINAVSGEIARASASNKKDIEPQLNAIQAEEKAVTSKFNEQMAANDQERDRMRNILREKQTEISKLENRVVDLQVNALDLRNSINTKVADKQVYRIALAAYNKETAADLEPRQVAFVAMLWFGSLALVVAVTGIVLAFASLVLRFGHIKELQKGTVWAKLARSIRLASIAIRKRSRQPKIIEKIVEKQVPVEVVKEVPVDKVVYREVPKEVVRREIVHVPMFTNNPALLNVGKSEESDN